MSRRAELSSTQDIIDFLQEYPTISILNFFRMDDLQELNGHHNYTFVGHVEDIEITDALIQSIIDTDVHDVNTNNPILKDKLIMSDAFSTFEDRRNRWYLVRTNKN